MNQPTNWSGKTAIITGASGGIGTSLARELSFRHFQLMLTGRDEAALEKTAAVAQEEGCEVEIFPADLTQEGAIDLLLEQTQNRFGGIDVLINNAGLAQNCGVEEVSEELFDNLMNINCKVPYFLCQKALPYLRASDCATIINICSVTAHKGYPYQSVYVASKHALLGFSKSLANEVYSEGIRVHTISPGGVYTRMVTISRPDLSPEGMILPEDIADIAAFYLDKRMSNAVIDEIELHRANKAPFA